MFPSLQPRRPQVCLQSSVGRESADVSVATTKPIAAITRSPADARNTRTPALSTLTQNLRSTAFAAIEASIANRSYAAVYVKSSRTTAKYLRQRDEASSVLHRAIAESSVSLARSCDTRLEPGREWIYIRAAEGRYQWDSQNEAMILDDI